MINANPKRYVLKQWNGGMSNDEYVGQPGSFYNGEGVEIRKNSKCFYLSNNGTFGNTVTSLGGYPTAFLGNSQSDMMVMLSNGKVIKFLDNSVLYTPTAPYQSIRNYVTQFFITGVGNVGILVGSGTAQISRFTYTSTPTITVTEGIIASGALTANTDYRPLLVDNDVLLIGDGEYVSSMDSNRAVTQALTLQSGDSVRAITRIGDQIVVFAVNGSNGKLYYWDGATTRPSRFIIWIDNPAYNIANLGNVTYCWNNNGIFIADGYARNFLYKSSQGETGINQNIYLSGQSTNAIETLDRVTYFPALSNSPLLTGTGAIIGYGEYQPGFPKAMVKDYTFGSNINAECTAMFWANAAVTGASPQLFIGYKQSSVFATLVYQTYGSSGFIETNPIIGDNESTIKQMKKIRFGYYLPHSSTSIKIYSKVNDATSYTLIKTQTTSPSQRRETFMYDTQWNKIQFKIELLSSNTSYTPQFFDLNVFYNEIDDDA